MPLPNLRSSMRWGKCNRLICAILLQHKTQSYFIILSFISIFAGSILILSIAILWFFVIAMLKIAGRNKVGFFAGRLIRPAPEGSTDTGVEVVIDNEAAAAAHTAHVDHVQKNFNARVVVVRVIFVLCGILTIVASILFYTKGVAAFKDSIDAMTRGIDVSEVKLCECWYCMVL